MRYRLVLLVQRVLLTVSIVVLVSMLLIVARVAGVEVPRFGQWIPQGFVSAAFARSVVLISGHAGHDPGAVCTDEQGQTIITEAEINAQVAEAVAQRLRRAGADVEILEEFDQRLTGLRADVLLSLHIDSCIDVSGYKAAHYTLSPISGEAGRLVACIDQAYPTATGLTQHSNTITHNMTNYHAFRVIDPQTPAAILELGFLGGDQELLTERQWAVVDGVVASLLCYLTPPQEADHATSVP
jgi:N-acetylmuramoyl-L-alanine amidase